jgi:DNA integrity scanning protein DisA with diadenylate cyclase activity
MRNTISLFMWGYQPYFRLSMERRSREVLGLVGPVLDAPLEPKALLAGVRTPEESHGHPVCVEPEQGEWKPAIFFGCAERAESIYTTHPGHSILYGDEPRMRDKPENIRRDSVRQAVREVTEAYDSSHGTLSFCGMATRVGGYHVAPILQFDRHQVVEYPQLPEPIRYGEYSAPAGLFESTIECLLREASSALAGREPGRFFDVMRGDANGILREAGDHFCSAITLATGDLTFQGVFETLNNISSLPYEGVGAIGELLFTPVSCRDVDVRVRLRTPVSLHNYRLARKMIETTGRNLSCVCTGASGISGLGVLQNKTADGVIRVRFSGHYNWDMYYKNVAVMQSAFGVPRLPRVKIKEAAFRTAVRRLFREIQEEAELRLWRIVEAVMKQRHGTIIVVSAAAEKEADRLKKQSIATERVSLTPDLVGQLTNIDGAILLDTNVVCHAIGVILDGMATEEGDPSRGARYNSALRYISSQPKSSTLCLVVSDDGYVNMLPPFRAQIRRSAVRKYINLLRTQDTDDCWESINWLDEHRFYLNAEECRVVNREVSRIYDAPLEVGEIRLEIPEFLPHPDMNDTYYVEEAEGEGIR